MNPAWFQAKSSHDTESTKPMQSHSHAAKMQGYGDNNKSRDQKKLNTHTMAASANPAVYGSVMAWLKSTASCALNDIRNACPITSLRS